MIRYGQIVAYALQSCCALGVLTGAVYARSEKPPGAPEKTYLFSFEPEERLYSSSYHLNEAADLTGYTVENPSPPGKAWTVINGKRFKGAGEVVFNRKADGYGFLSHREDGAYALFNDGKRLGPFDSIAIASHPLDPSALTFFGSKWTLLVRIEKRKFILRENGRRYGPFEWAGDARIVSGGEMVFREYERSRRRYYLHREHGRASGPYEWIGFLSSDATGEHWGYRVRDARGEFVIFGDGKRFGPFLPTKNDIGPVFRPDGKRWWFVARKADGEYLYESTGKIRGPFLRVHNPVSDPTGRWWAFRAGSINGDDNYVFDLNRRRKLGPFNLLHLHGIWLRFLADGRLYFHVQRGERYYVVFADGREVPVSRDRYMVHPRGKLVVHELLATTATGRNYFVFDDGRRFPVDYPWEVFFARDRERWAFTYRFRKRSPPYRLRFDDGRVLGPFGVAPSVGFNADGSRWWYHHLNGPPRSPSTLRFDDGTQYAAVYGVRYTRTKQGQYVTWLGLEDRRLSFYKKQVGP